MCALTAQNKGWDPPARFDLYQSFSVFLMFLGTLAIELIDLSEKISFRTFWVTENNFLVKSGEICPFSPRVSFNFFKYV